MPEIVCLLDVEGRVVRANHIVKRWGWEDPAAVRGMSLHELLHAECRDPECYLARFGVWGRAELLAGRHAQCSAFDPLLRRDLAIHAQPTDAASKQWNRYYGSSDLLAVVTIGDITAMRRAEERMLAPGGKRSRTRRGTDGKSGGASGGATRKASSSSDSIPGRAAQPARARAPAEIAPAAVRGTLTSTLFGILHETVNKLLEHDKESVSVSVERKNDSLQLCIEQEGRGDDIEGQLREHAAARLGLGTLEQRAELSGGAYRMESAGGRGTRIRISWPLRLDGR